MGNDLEKKLEPPKLGFRRKKAKDEPETTDAAEPSTEPSTEPSSEPRTAVEDEPTVVVPAAEDDAATAPESAGRTSLLKPVKSLKSRRPQTPGPTNTPKPPKARTEKPERPSRVPAEVPISDGPLAAGATGLVVGLFLVVAVWLCEQLSQQVRGTTSLGKAGFPLLVGIFILAVVVGSLLLRLAKVPSPGSVSFLGTGLVAVIAMLFLGDHNDTFWGAVVVVVLTIAAFVLSRWVTVRYIDTE